VEGALPDGSAANFFDRYSRFRETSIVGTQDKHGRRLDWRWRAIIGAHHPLFDGARVLDLASHDGRWSMAALDAGASQVVGIEGRQSLVDHAKETFAAYGIERKRYRFVLGDVLEQMPTRKPGAFDLILNLGFLYHTPKHYEVFEQMCRLKPKAIVLDTVVAQGEGIHARYYVEPTGWDGAAIGDGRAFVGAPTHAMIALLAKFFKFRLQAVDWTTLGITDWTGLEDYATGQRRTYVLTAPDYN
jgi:hypothetical protein